MFESRVAFFTDTFDEPNGVATISQMLRRFACQNGIPLLLIRPGAETRSSSEGSSCLVELGKSFLSFPLDTGMRFDLLTARHLSSLRIHLERFKPDVVHVTGPGDVGMLGARLAHLLRLPLVISWHTNLHQYARLRCRKYFRVLPPLWAQRLEAKTEHFALRAAARFYQVADLILAPNDDILGTITSLTAKPGRLMPHGVDCGRFQPRSRELVDPSRTHPFTIGYVGRLTPEKNVRVLAELEAELLSRGFSDIRLMVVGEGSERAWLARRMKRAVFRGVLREDALAAAYSEMDVFVFPSASDTLGLVLLEAMASGLPIIAFRTSGPCAVVRNAKTGFLAETVSDIVDLILRLALDHRLRLSLGDAARLQALEFSWDTVFTCCYEAYAAARGVCSRSIGVAVQSGC